MQSKINKLLNIKVDIRLLILLGFISANIIGYTYALISGKYNGDFLNLAVSLDSMTLTKIILVVVVQFVIVYIIYCFLTKSLKVDSFIKKTDSINNLFYYIIFLIMVINFFITYLYNFPIAGQASNFKFAFFVTRIKIVDAVLILYCIERTNKNKNYLFWILVIGAIVLNIYRGWSGHIFVFLILEVMIFFKSKINLKKTILITLASILFILFIYPKVFDVKNYIRSGGDMSFITTTYDGLIHISGRFSHFSQIAQIVEKKPDVTRIVENEIGKFHYFKDALSVFIPGKIISNYDEKKSLHSYMLALFDENFDYNKLGGASTTGIVGKFIALSYFSIIDATFYLLFVLFLLFATVFIFSKFHPYLKYYCFIIIIFYTLSGVIQEIVYPGFQIVFWGSGIILTNYIYNKLKFNNIQR